ncbi:MAG: M2 family metallopeptidase [Hyphomonadaceae bacterium]
MRHMLLGTAATLTLMTIAACAPPASNTAGDTPAATPPAATETTTAPAETVAAPVETAATDTTETDTDTAPTVDEARAFIAGAEAELSEYSEYAARIFWNQATNITYDTNWLAAKVGSEGTQMVVRLANGTKRFEGMDLPQDLERKMSGLRSGITIPAPSGKEIADELANITTGLETTYSTGTIDIRGGAFSAEEIATIVRQLRDPEGTDPDLDVSGSDIAQHETELLMSMLDDPAQLSEVWTKWNDYAAVMRDDYARMVEIANLGAEELGFDNVAQMWLSNYDMPADDMEAEVERLWTQVEPLYDELHCYVRGRLSEQYGTDIQPADGPIRADLLGNMWGQQWGNIYSSVAPEASGPTYDLTEILVENGYTAKQMVETGEAFFTSLGFEPLPDTFWERSQITKPRDRDVVCHASAWDLDDADDIRIKMCTEINADDFQTVHHELGHNFYQRAYKAQDPFFRGGANDGFHEAIGDFIGLSITPEYLRQIGLIDASQVPDASADTGLLMGQALDKIAFLPFGLMVDKWRWQVFRGETSPAEYTESWVALREQYQGITPPTSRPADAFDPGAKYHIPGNTPYLRYFLSFVMQFQFHQAACEQAGWEGPLHRCSIYNNKEVGARFKAMMEMGASQPWPDALEAFTGTREMDGSAIIAYFDPLMVYLREENAGQTCGWKE